MVIKILKTIPIPVLVSNTGIIKGKIFTYKMPDWLHAGWAEQPGIIWIIKIVAPVKQQYWILSDTCHGKDKKVVPVQTLGK